jgi:hypothetical protein
MHHPQRCSNMPAHHSLNGADSCDPGDRRSESQGRLMPNVIVFGETGAGKSSVLNMLNGTGGNTGNVLAGVSDQAAGMTFSNTAYEKTIFGSTFNVFDTVGLNEGSAGTVRRRDAIERLHNLIHQLNDGVSLHVMRAPRIKTTTKHNYDMFYNIFCQKKVPIVIIITGLEERENMDSWWEENEPVFLRQGMSFGGCACITATKGKRGRNEEYYYKDEYEESKKKVEDLISCSCRQDPWEVPPTGWFNFVVLKLLNLLVLVGIQIDLNNELFHALQTYGGLSDREAIAEALRVERTHRNAR